LKRRVEPYARKLAGTVLRGERLVRVLPTWLAKDIAALLISKGGDSYSLLKDT